MKTDWLIVGAGFAGAVLAERLAAAGDRRVVICDRRPHVGGNAHDRRNEEGLLLHPYGPKVFHTSSEEVWGYLSRFTAWRPYQHRVLAQVDGALVPLPDDLAAAPARKLYQDYLRKQWGLDPARLHASVLARLPVELGACTDRHQAMPREGFTRLFERMLAHPNITVLTGVDHRDLHGSLEWERMIYTGPIDAFFRHRFGPLPYRALEVKHQTVRRDQVQPVGTIIHPGGPEPHTRVTELKHLTGDTHPGRTTLAYEHPRADGEPRDPILTAENQALHARYAALAQEQTQVHFAGRLATYRDLAIDQVVAQALTLFRRLMPGHADPRPAEHAPLQGSRAVSVAVGA